MMTPELRSRVEEVYRRVDAAVAKAGPRCDASGRCCRFHEYDHTLFISHFEAEILLQTAPTYAKPVTGEFCPFQVNNICTARAERPLGCRIYFCDPVYEPRQFDITEDAIRSLKVLADEYEVGWQYAPLHHFLNAAERETTPTSHDGRIALPLVPE